MASNVSPTGATGGDKPIRHVEDGEEQERPAPTERPQDPRLPDSIGSRAPASIRTATAVSVTAARSQAPNASDHVIDPRYIETLEVNAMSAYPPDGDYPPTILRYPPSLQNEIGGARHVISPYNPLDLRLPFHLMGFRVLYDLGPTTKNDIRAKAITSHLELAKQYNLAYIDFLRAANGSDEAVSRLETNLVDGRIFDAADVQTALLSIDAESLLLDIQGHLCLQVLRCADAEVPTAARIRALEIVREHFDVATIAEALSGGTDGETGKALTVRGHEKIFDLIPQRFIVDEEEATKSHASRFLRNAYVQSIFFGYENASRPFRLSALELSTKYPEETVQTLVSIMRAARAEPKAKAAAFQALINLTTLDEPSKARIFGENASYRNGGKSLSNPAADADSDSIR